MYIRIRKRVERPLTGRKLKQVCHKQQGVHYEETRFYPYRIDGRDRDHGHPRRLPKLFGMIAKSKASEVGPAAGEYVKLQNAYIAESGDMLGNWFLIGYKGPGDVTTKGTKTTAETSESTNFIYTGEFAGSVALATGGVGWKAANKAKLNDCAGTGTTWNWTISVAAGQAAGEATYTPGIPSPDCEVLTPSFKAIK